MWFLIIILVSVTAISIYRKNPAVKGHRSEQELARKLGIDSILKHGGKTLTNVYVPTDSGTTSEIDVLYITRKGLFVFENKNYAGYVFGSESNKTWTVTLYGGKSWYGGKIVEKHQFYNPIWQNRTHIKNLMSYLNANVKTFSVISFSDRGSLKDITVNSPNVYVCNHSSLSGILRMVWNTSPDILTEEQVDDIYERLSPLTNANKAMKQKHISDISERFITTYNCPVCGGALTLRTAKKGNAAGKQFYGCSNYPKCKFTRNV